MNGFHSKSAEHDSFNWEYHDYEKIKTIKEIMLIDNKFDIFLMLLILFHKFRVKNKAILFQVEGFPQFHHNT